MSHCPGGLYLAQSLAYGGDSEFARPAFLPSLSFGPLGLFQQHSQVLASESPGRPVKTHIAGPHPQGFLFSAGEG